METRGFEITKRFSRESWAIQLVVKGEAATQCHQNVKFWLERLYWDTFDPGMAKNATKLKLVITMRDFMLLTSRVWSFFWSSPKGSYSVFWVTLSCCHAIFFGSLRYVLGFIILLHVYCTQDMTWHPKKQKRYDMYSGHALKNKLLI